MSTTQPQSPGMRQLLMGLFAVAVALSVVGWLTQPEPPPPPVDGIEVTLTDGNFQQEVLVDSGYVLVDFWIEACPYCVRMEPAIAHLSLNYRGRVKVGRLNADWNTAVAQQLNVEGFPTLLLFRHGRVVSRWDGYGGLRELSGWLDEHLAASTASGTADAPGAL